MGEQIKILSYNCRGLHDHVKRRKLFLWFQDQKIDIVMLQETFCTPKLEPYLRASWDGEVRLSLTDSCHSRGVAILFRKDFPGKVVDCYSTKDGRLVIVNIELLGETISLVSLYTPNNETEKINFFKSVTNVIKSNCQNLNNLIVGDFNTSLKVIDRYPVAARIDRCIASLNNMLQSCKLVDSWNTKYPSTPGFTYYDKKNKCHSRLDYMMIGKHSSIKLKQIEITQPIRDIHIVDHSAIKVTFSFLPHPKGKGYWKLNNSVLKDDEYTKGINDTIDTTVNSYIKLNSHQLIWEILKVNIKEFSINFCKAKAKSLKSKCNENQIELDSINKVIAGIQIKNSLSETERNTLLSLTTKKKEIQVALDKHYENKAKGYCIRSRAKWIREGEVGSRYFLSLEKQRQADNVIREVKVGDRYITDGNQIISEAVHYYSNLYKIETFW